jgi:hypothetical protein
MMGGALGRAVLASLADSRSSSLLAHGDSALAALTSGYHLSFVVGALFALCAAAIGAGLLHNAAMPAHEPEQTHGGVPATDAVT